MIPIALISLLSRTENQSGLSVLMLIKLYNALASWLVEKRIYILMNIGNLTSDLIFFDLLDGRPMLRLRSAQVASTSLSFNYLFRPTYK